MPAACLASIAIFAVVLQRYMDWIGTKIEDKKIRS
jgi:hypothetical protein